MLAMGNSVTAPFEWFPEELSVWRPPEKLTISEWSEKCRVLTEPAEEKGPLRLIRTPYLRPIMDAFLDPEVETIVLCKSAQIAGAEGMLSVVGYFAHQEACPIMVVLADEDTAKYISRERLQKMFRASPELGCLIVEETFGLNEIALGNGAYVAMAWASSVAKLASRPIRVLILDEVDKPGYYVSSREASPISLGIERTETYWNKKIGILSTPTDELGNICKHLASCDVIFDWHVACPHCGQFQPLVWNLRYAWGFENGRYRAIDGTMHSLGQVVWEGGRHVTEEQIEKAGYQCGECGAVWNSIEKNLAVENGIPAPRSELPSKIRKVGFHIWRLYSLLGKSGDIPKLVRDFLAALKARDPKELQGFVNSTLAQPFKMVLSTQTAGDLVQCKTELPAQHVPSEAIALTCGIDVQKYGFWFLVRAWSRDYTSSLVHYGQLSGWDEVEELLFRTAYPIVGANEFMRIWRAGIDTGGGERDGAMSSTEETYWWIRKNGIGKGCRVWGIKGSSSPLRGKVHLGNVLDKTPSGKAIPGGLQLVLLDTAQIKDSIHYRLDLAKQHQPMGAYLHADTDHTYFSQILSEEKRRNRKGLEEWVQLKGANHLLDCEMINHALADPEWPGGGVHLLRHRAAPASFNQGAAPRVSVRSHWMGR
jgi:terminase, large subunit